MIGCTFSDYKDRSLVCVILLYTVFPITYIFHNVTILVLGVVGTLKVGDKVVL